jgi:hypothetical protein
MNIVDQTRPNRQLFDNLGFYRRHWGLRAMLDQIDIVRCANLLLKNYGSTDAAYRAASRAEACLEQGDANGQKVWLQVVAAIKNMAGSDRNLTGVVH